MDNRLVMLYRSFGSKTEHGLHQRGGKIIRKAASLFIVLALAFAPTANAGDLYFDLANSTGVDIYYLYMSPSNVDSWEEDMLGDDILPSGTTVEVGIADGRTDCVYDIRAEFADGDVVEDFGVDLCDLGFYEFY